MRTCVFNAVRYSVSLLDRDFSSFCDHCDSIAFLKFFHILCFPSTFNRSRRARSSSAIAAQPSQRICKVLSGESARKTKLVDALPESCCLLNLAIRSRRAKVLVSRSSWTGEAPLTVACTIWVANWTNCTIVPARESAVKGSMLCTTGDDHRVFCWSLAYTFWRLVQLTTTMAVA